MLKGEPEYEAEIEEESLFEHDRDEGPPPDVVYSPKIPIDTFDFIITDECHRSIYNRWRPVLEYFDAFIIGLTATPSKHTLGFFNQNLVTEYSHERAVADGVNVGYEVYRIRTQITEHGSRVESGHYVDKRDKLTRERRWEQLDEDLDYESNALDQSVVAIDQIRTVIKTFKEKLFTEIFPGRTEVPKTLIFAKDDSHAEDIVRIIWEEFGRGNEFCKKITYRTTGEKPEALIAQFRNSYNPRIAVTVDMISTGTDIKPLECLLFMRMVNSQVYYEQMKGRGTRVISPTDLEAVSPDAKCKTHFVIVDAVGVCERDKTDSRPLERKRHVPLDKMLISVASGVRDTDTITSLAGKLARLDRRLDTQALTAIQDVSGKPLTQMIHELLDAVDPDKQFEKAQDIAAGRPIVLTDGDSRAVRLTAERPPDDGYLLTPTDEQISRAAEMLMTHACTAFDDPAVRETIVNISRKNEQVIDTVSQDEVTHAGFDAQAKERAQTVVNTFKQFIEENQAELTALQIIFNQPYGRRHLTYQAIKELAEAIERPPYRLTTEQLWSAYEQLEQSKVRGAGPQKLLTNIISLIRFAIGESAQLEPFMETVNHRFDDWISEQQAQGKPFTPEQMAWLQMIRDRIATSLGIEMDDFEYTPFHEKGGTMKVYQLFGDNLSSILTELNERLAA